MGLGGRHERRQRLVGPGVDVRHPGPDRRDSGAERGRVRQRGRRRDQRADRLRPDRRHRRALAAAALRVRVPYQRVQVHRPLRRAGRVVRADVVGRRGPGALPRTGSAAGHRARSRRAVAGRPRRGAGPAPQQGDAARRRGPRHLERGLVLHQSVRRAERGARRLPELAGGRAGQALSRLADRERRLRQGLRPGSRAGDGRRVDEAHPGSDPPRWGHHGRTARSRRRDPGRCRSPGSASGSVPRPDWRVWSSRSCARSCAAPPGPAA